MANETVIRPTDANDGAALARFAGGAPSHPAIEIRYSRGPGPVSTSKVHHTGLTKRELFAAMAMQGLASNGRWETDHNVHQTAAEAVSYADALLQELAK